MTAILKKLRLRLKPDQADELMRQAKAKKVTPVKLAERLLKRSMRRPPK